MQWYDDASIYIFKISGDTTYMYIDEDPPEKTLAYIDSISNGTLEKTVNLGDIQDSNGEIYTKNDLNKIGAETETIYKILAEEIDKYL